MYFFVKKFDDFNAKISEKVGYDAYKKINNKIIK